MRAKRVKALKKIIILSLITGMVIPIVLCVLLLFKVHVLEQQIQELYTLREARQEEEASADVSASLPEAAAAVDSMEAGILEAEEAQETDAEAQSETYQEEVPARLVHLTFDDGPSIYTEEILDILAEYQVKATFFVTGKEDEHSREMYKRIVQEGHTLGMHSYSHRYKEIYASKESFISDLDKLQDYLYGLTGEKPMLYRFPGGSSNKVSSIPMREFIQVLDERGIRYHDWNISSGDANSGYISADRIVENCTQGLSRFREATVLMHDAADKRTTVEALPIIISKIQEMDETQIVPITEESVPIQHIKD